MQIRQRLTYQFLSIVAVILLFYSMAVFFFSSQYRRENFYDRLKSKAINVANLLIDVEGIDSMLLEQIEKDNPLSLPSERIIVYDHRNEVLFSTDSDRVFNVGADLLDEIRLQHEIRFRRKQYEMLGILYTSRYDRFVVIAGAVDIYGQKKLTNLKTVLLAAFGFSIVIIFFAGGIYARRALLPISKIVSQVDSIGAFNMEKRLDEGNKTDEIGRLAGTFNKMLDRLGSAFTVQKNFIANASHELRTPMTSISGQLEVLNLQSRTPEQYKETITSVLDDVKKMNLITNRLLLLAQASAESTSLAFKPVRIDELLWQTKTALEKANPGWVMRIRFDSDMGEEQLKIMGNEQLLRSALINLAENGCKYSPGKQVDVSLTHREKRLILLFRDRGIGIPAVDLPHVFEPFYRGKNTEKFPGHGIGLSLVQKIMQLHKGEVLINSEENLGTSITLVFPLPPF